MNKNSTRVTTSQNNTILLAVGLSAIGGLTALPVCAQNAATATIEEIVVTAQRREERIEDVPISVKAFDQGTLDNLKIDSTDQLQFSTPGIVNTATAGDGISAVFIRGVGTGYSGPGLEGSVAVYLDDVYLQTQTSSGQSSIDVSQIQILKGPQGTLYGRNATGGAIIVETNDPTLEEIDGYMKFGYGDLDWTRAEGVLNLPLGDTFALRFAGFFEDREGYVSNVAVPNYEKSGVGAGETYSARIKALWQPTDDFRTLLKLAKDKRNGNGAVHSLRYNADGSRTGLGFYKTAQSPNREGGGGDDTESQMASWRVEYDLDSWSITNTLAYRETRAYGCTDNDGVVDELLYFCTVSGRSPNPGSADGKEDNTLTNELRLTSNHDGPFNITAGLFYERNEARFVGRIGGDWFNGTPTFDNRDDLKAYSTYFDASYQITDALKISGGLRYTREQKEHSVRNDQDAFDLLGGGFPYYSEGDTDFENVSPRVVLSYDAGNTNYYASYSEGFKSGGFNSPSLTLDPVLDSEEISAFEVGAKYKSDDGSLALSGAVYYYDWDDVQVAFITGGGSGILQQNAAGARNYGGEINLDWAPAEAWRISAGFGYTHARFTDFPQAAVYNLVNGFLTATAEDLKDKPVPQAPDETANLAVTYLYGLESGWHGHVTAAARYSSEYDFTSGAGGELRASRQDPLTLVNLTGSVKSPSGSYELGWFVSNLLDEEYIQLVSTGNTGVYMTPAEPRLWGATFKYNF